MDRTLTRAEAPTLEVIASRGFPDWLAGQRLGLACTAYQSGKVLMIGVGDSGRLSVCERTFDRCTGLWSDGRTLWMATAFQLWRFESAPPLSGASSGDTDRLFVPRACLTTGDADVHDLTLDASGRPVFVSTLLSCLAAPHDLHGLEVVWRPPFVSRLAAEDRCHLNGLATVDGRPGFVTACARSDVADGWRDHRRDGGCLIDVRTDAVVLDGLSMPHSPRWYRDRLWLLNAGTGEFGFADLERGRFEPVAFCPGFARGLAFIGDFAVMGLGLPRDSAFRGLELDAQLARRGAAPRCGLQVIDLRSGDAVHWVRFGGPVTEVYDVVPLPGALRPRLLGFRNDEARRALWAFDGEAVQNWQGQ